MKIFGRTKSQYLVSMSVEEIIILTQKGEELRNRSSYGASWETQEHIVGMEIAVAAIHSRICEVLNAKEKLNRVARELGGLASICENVDMAIPQLPGEPEKS